MRFFNTAGPIQPDINYCIPPLERLDLDDVLGMIRTRKYFVLHAPRQTGKTSTPLALRGLLNSGAVGNIAAYCERGRRSGGVRGDAGHSQRTVVAG